MKIEENIIQLLEAMLQAYLFPDGAIISADEFSMPGVGYSDAALRRFEVQYASIKGQNKSLIRDKKRFISGMPDTAPPTSSGSSVHSV